MTLMPFKKNKFKQYFTGYSLSNGTHIKRWKSKYFKLIVCGVHH